ncbi:hypothetical protein JCM19992_01580 [Thermostilla marina]
MRRVVALFVLMVFGIGFCAIGCEPAAGTGNAGTTGVSVVGGTPPCCAGESEKNDSVATEHDADEAAAAEAADESTETPAAPSADESAEQPAEENAE